MRYPNLKAEMTRYGIKTSDISELLDINERSVRGKINGGVYADFKINEGKKIRDSFFPASTLDYLFEDINEFKNQNNENQKPA